MIARRWGAGVAVGIALAACGPITEEQSAPSRAECSSASAFHASDVDPLKELLIVDDRVMSDDAATNALAGPLSFRHAIEAILPEGDDPAAAALEWLDGWAPAALRCDWLRARPENACDASCGTCADREVDLAHAPFRLIAVANRLDLGESGEQNAEGRLLFGATDGPGDDPRSPSLPVTVIFEFRLAGAPHEWAARWHALGGPGEVDGAWVLSLTEVTKQFVRSEDFGQVRVHDASGTRGVMYEFHLDANAKRLVRAGLRRTPAHSMNDSAVLHDFARSNDEAILSDRYELPGWMLTDRIELGETWTLPGIDEPLRRAFAQGTCDGCHGREHPTTDGGFHVSPRRRGAEKLSRFLFDPEHREEDELSRRAAVLARVDGLRCSQELVPASARSSRAE